MSKLKAIAIILLAFFAGAFFGSKIKFGPLSSRLGKGDGEIKERFTSVREKGYQFTNPLLECDAAEDTFTELRPFRDKVERLLGEEKQKGNITFASVYFRDLNNGPWFGVNEKEEFSPASLLKLPVAMAYYKMSETDSGLLSREYTYDGDAGQPDLTQSIKPSQTLETGKSYTVKELIYRSVVYSDNRAFYLLADHVDDGILNKIFADFAVPYSANSEDMSVAVKNYAGFFRILFNSSYLNKQNSEELLGILSKVEYRDALAAGVPANVAVAHKFGERNEAEKQLHDCGIVYYPQHPYLACIMTRGADAQKLTRAIGDVSKLIYSEVDAQMKEKN